ncbi:hypothetical protein A5742_05015 [Mycolicibacterium fortuitum]|uniref:Uncharacterized protein n=1 Tax=Mycolicibacterium fortuitum TaxID=1766 RepID=A0ABD6QIK0_MYCFO|nr:hypothetical protein [Mycolicibacterium fortuitum]OMC39573.1 hypothetical protein A5742_05015 [Mycolicibacterium fortuitum]
MPLSPLDDYLVHQIPETLDHVGTSDRNFYERYYFNIHDQTGEVFAVIGLGQYPNLNITDAFAAVMYEGVQHTVRSSRLLGNDRMNTTVAPLGVHLIEGLRTFRVCCAPNEWGVQFDLTFEAGVPALEEPPTLARRHTRIVEDTRRLVQTGHWTGTLEVAGRRFDVVPETWWGARDHSWGIRAVGEREAPGFARTKFGFGGAGDHLGGGLVNWSPIQFPDFSLFYFVYEGSDGIRAGERATRVDSLASGGQPIEMGSPRHNLRFIEGTHLVEGGSIVVPDPTTNREMNLEFTALSRVYLDVGTGYGRFDAPHGSYLGDSHVEGGHWKEAECRERSDIDSALLRYRYDDQHGYAVMDTRIVNNYYPRYGFE